MTNAPVIHWFRRDLRLTDNLALAAAAQSGLPVLPVFILDPALVNSRRVGLPRLAFMLKGLAALDMALRAQGSRLWLGYGDPRLLMPALVQLSGAQALFYNRDYSPLALRRDQAAVDSLTIPVHSFDDALLLPPGSVMTESGKPFTVFTPFKRKWLTLPKQTMADPVPTGAYVDAATVDTLRLQTADGRELPLQAIPSLADLGLSAAIPVPAASEAEAARRLDDFLNQRVYHYAEGRNGMHGTVTDDTLGGWSFLSPYLRMGMLSPRQAYWGARHAYTATGQNQARESVETWVSELVWREFYMHILYHFPHVAAGSFRPQYDRLAWRYAPDELAAWKEGMTGFPVVDAAMRQLKTMGWMPNRARMIVASFLAKDLLIDWREGERHFMDWLIDGDPAANNGGWQWSAGTGTDAQPYFRIFNPASQSEKFDPEGTYIRRWVPELRAVPTRFIHAPWENPPAPQGYPPPIVDRTLARERTLAAFKAVGDNR
ncbi:MAG: deoxyribodipyrimidine photo-lyase [Anaerolineae bacterium]|nr:deoxyribodipyrimidine photo-lyase [Anaerolineae bacterium]